jgi:hypothetical protein
VIFRDVKVGDMAVKDRIYGYKGTSGLAADDGVFSVDFDGNLMIETKSGDIVKAFNAGTYESIVMAITEMVGTDRYSQGIFTDTQTLVVEEINQAIINEIKVISLDPACDDKCSIAEWQKLQQKKLGAYVHFLEANFRKAQIILESARQACSQGNNYC